MLIPDFALPFPSFSYPSFHSPFHCIDGSAILRWICKSISQFSMIYLLGAIRLSVSRINFNWAIAFIVRSVPWVNERHITVVRHSRKLYNRLGILSRDLARSNNINYRFVYRPEFSMTKLQKSDSHSERETSTRCSDLHSRANAPRSYSECFLGALLWNTFTHSMHEFKYK